jgi:hypothetical protein
MSISTIVQQYAEEIGGTFTEYDHTKSIIVVPLKDSRFQTVMSVLEKSSVSDKMRLIFSSKVSDTSDQVNARELLEQNGKFDFSKFVLDEGQLKVEASCLADSASADEVKYMIQEVAQLADQFEFRLTGRDVH